MCQETPRIILQDFAPFTLQLLGAHSLNFPASLRSPPVFESIESPDI